MSFPDTAAVFPLIEKLGWLAFEVPGASSFDLDGVPRYSPRADGKFCFCAGKRSGVVGLLAGARGPIAGDEPMVKAVAPTREESLYLVYREICLRMGRVPEV